MRRPQEIRRKAEAVAGIDAALITSTLPGRTLGDIFQLAVDSYGQHGYPQEWQLHHQGGPAGYEPREYLARPNSPERVVVGQVYAWNPSITGTKSEDTILVGERGCEILARMSVWPSLTVEVQGSALERPAILEVT